MTEAQTHPRKLKGNHLEFLYELYTSDIQLADSDILLLKEHNYIASDTPAIKREHTGKFKKPVFRDQTVKHELEQQADESVDIVSDEFLEQQDITLLDEQDYQQQKSEGGYLYSGTDKEIKREDWMPKSIMEHTKQFIEFIDSHLYHGIANLKSYEPYQLYCQQAQTWIAQNPSETDFSTQEEKEEYWDEETKRCNDNSLYFLDRYLMLKDGDMNSGSKKYDSKPVHKFLAFMYDSGYSMEIGKGRQIAASSTLGGLGLKTLLFMKNGFIKFITQDVLTGTEIFEDKIKYPFGELPEDLKPNVANDRDNLFKLATREKRGTRGGVGSKLQVVAPSVSAINGGSPDKVFIDEAGYIGILGKMIKEGRPTMFSQDSKTGKLVMRRQLIVWGTGGEMDKGGKAYEQEYYSTLRMWQQRDFSSGIIPIFFDWRCRPGITQEHYDKEKAVYYAVEGPEAQASRIQFHQTYPSSVEDMFLTSLKTLVGIDYIVNSLDRIRKYSATQKPQAGFFEPIYDTAKPASDHSDVPYEIIGANFIPCDGPADPRVTTIIFQHPKRWRHRYYQGTDPVASDNGLSKMASAIWDAHYCTVSAIVNYREANHKYTYLQSTLLGVYYNTEPLKKGVKELIESNIGKAYMDYKEAKGLFSTMVFNSELSPSLRTQIGQAQLGLDNKGIRNKLIIDKMHEMLSAFGDNLYIDEIFIQLKTFVCTFTSNGRETWGPLDRRLYQDDVLFAMVFAYICSLCYNNRPPEAMDVEIRSRTFTAYELQYDKDFNQSRVPIRKHVR